MPDHKRDPYALDPGLLGDEKKKRPANLPHPDSRLAYWRWFFRRNPWYLVAMIAAFGGAWGLIAIIISFLLDRPFFSGWLLAGALALTTALFLVSWWLTERVERS